MSSISPAPSTPQTAHKAVVGSIIAAVSAGAATLYTALDDGIVSSQEVVGIAVAVLGSLGATYAAVFITSNKPSVEEHDESAVGSEEPLDEEPYPGTSI